MNKSKNPTWKSVADDLGVNVQTLYKWRREEDDCPETYDLKLWKDWLSKRSQKQGHGGGRLAVEGEEFTAKQIQDLKGAKLKAEAAKESALAQLRELELSMKRDNLIPMSNAISLMTDTLTPLRRLLDRMPRALCAKANPENPKLAEKACTAYLDDTIYPEIQDIIEKLTKSQ